MKNGLNPKDVLKSVLRWNGVIFSLPKLINWTGQRVFLPFYHTVGATHDLPHIAHLYQPRTIQQFEKDLDYLLKFYTPVDLDFLHKKKYLKQPQKNYFHLSFDDGLREVFDIAAPILLKKGVPASIFLNTNFVNNQDLFFRYKASLIVDYLKNKGNDSDKTAVQKIAPEGVLNIHFLNKNKLDEIATLLNLDFKKFLQEQQPYLTINQIVTLKNQGFTFGGHSLNHPLFSQINLARQLNQAIESTHFAKKITKQQLGAFAFPFTDFGVNADFFNTIFTQKAIDISFGTAGLKQQRYAQHWQRFPMEGTNWEAAKLIKTEYLYYLVKRVFNKH